ncbi:unnamed protein product [Ceratitis capitata]|uniref:(Mediterranean fruit fly) hypothetical protein n=1 Tax=Ceratitis capitata TaxID=7213 RepID=A0A811UH24_CERCA|nr:unnamed protein product [Ceratitis capitata]
METLVTLSENLLNWSSGPIKLHRETIKISEGKRSHFDAVLKTLQDKLDICSEHVLKLRCIEE